MIPIQDLKFFFLLISFIETSLRAKEFYGSFAKKSGYMQEILN